MVVAGTNFALLHAAIVRRRPSALARDEEFRVYLVILVLTSLLVVVELHTVHPEQVAPLRIGRARVDERALRATIVFVFLYVGVCAVGAVVVLVDSALHDLPLTAFGSLAVSATTLGGVGPGLGFAGPMGSFQPFSDLSTLVLTGLMYLGRLEIIPFLVLLSPGYWRQ